jgi:Fe-S cluster biogenesis protein NfuA
MFIKCEETPNPNTLKFIIEDIKISDIATHFDREDVCTESPLAQHLFKTKEISSVLLGEHFVSITKCVTKEWEEIRTGILASLIDFFHSKQQSIIITNKPEKKELSSVEKEIVDVIRTKVRPHVAQDGGDVVFHEFKDNVVYLKLQGACKGCPSAVITLKQGIENMLKHYIPEVKSVEQIF